MPYIGNTPALDYISYAVQNFTVTAGTTSYSLDYSVANENDIRLVINNVIQRPGASYAYSATGTTLTLTSATLVTDTMYAVFIGRAVQTVLPPANINIQLADGTAAAPSLNFANDTNTGIFRPTTDTIAFTEGGTEAMRIDSSGNVAIGDTSIIVPSGYSRFLAVGDNNTGIGQISSDVLGLATGGINRIRIRSNGDIEVNEVETPHSQNTSGAFKIYGLGSGATAVGLTSIARVSGSPLLVNRVTDDGNLIEFFQAGTPEGTISISGTTVSYNGFTGSHWSRFIDGSKPDVLRGTVIESLDQMTDWYHVEFTDSKNNLQKKPYALKAGEQEGDVITYNFEGIDYQATIIKEVDVKHVMSKISDTVEAKNVYGVFSAWDNDDLINNDFYVASVGSFVVRIKAGQVVAKGDLLQSNGDGTAKVQADDIIRASTFAKVLSNTVIQTYEDGSFIVPCSLMC